MIEELAMKVPMVSMTVGAMLLLHGCGGNGPEKGSGPEDVPGKPMKAHLRLIQEITRGDYTIYHPRPHRTHVREVEHLFDCKEAYPWLIAAMDSRDPAVVETVMFYWNTSAAPGPLTRESLQEWYDVPNDQLKFDGAMWRPQRQ